MTIIRLDRDSFLRVLERDDAWPLFLLTVQNRQHLSRWLPWARDVREVTDTEQFVAMTIRQRENHQGWQMGIWHRGQLAGVLGVHQIDWQNRSTVMGYWLGQSFQGRGLMTAAVRMYLNELVFGRWNLNRAEIAAATENARSRAIPERLGFTLEGILRQRENLHGRFVDHAVYGILAQEWRARNGETVETIPY